MSLSKKLGLHRVEFALSNRSFLTHRTKAGQVRDLIARLHPQQTGIPLIRLGPNGDGGYLVPDDLSGLAACFSPGVNTVSDFEDACAGLGMDVFMADASVEGPAVENPRFRFLKQFIGAFSDGIYISMEDWVRNAGLSGEQDLLLQMDIEGFEYESLLTMPMSLQRRFRIMVIEFHYLDQLWNRYYFSLVSRVFEKLLKTHTCVHIHPNNFVPSVRYKGIEIPALAEFTFLRSDRAPVTGPAQQFPHPLDHDNCDREMVVLPDIWYM